MKKQFFIANWKSHKNVSEAKEWLSEFSILNSQPSTHKEAILCPPFPLLPLCHTFIQQHHLPLSLGSQTISSYPEGAYTGEVSARLLKDFVNYTLIGHSERRKFFHETDEDIAQKAMLARSHQISPVLLLNDKNAAIPKGVDIVIYEPPSAISSDKGIHPESPEDVDTVAAFLKQKSSVIYVLYGGSVTPENVQEYTRLSSIDGVIVGGESLKPDSFASIIQHA